MLKAVKHSPQSLAIEEQHDAVKNSFQDIMDMVHDELKLAKKADTYATYDIATIAKHLTAAAEAANTLADYAKKIGI